MKVYVASKTRHATFWKRLREGCSIPNVEIVSTWIDESEKGQTEDLQELSVRCLNEIKASDFLLLLSQDDDILKGALVEAGAALALGKPVAFIGRYGSVGVFERHPLWLNFRMVAEALEYQGAKLKD